MQILSWNDEIAIMVDRFLFYGTFGYKFYYYFMYTEPPTKVEHVEVEPVKDLVTDMAQRLYDHFSHLQLNEEEWLTCLEDFLANSRINGDETICTEDVRSKISSILENDKKIPLNRISDTALRAVYREVAEWLVAEKIVEKMVNYELSIEEGLALGRYQEFEEINEVNVINDDADAFGAAFDSEEIIEFIKANYVVDMRGAVIGAGTRVEVRELKPKKFPLPYPARAENDESLMLKIPNRFLVVRLSKSSYKDVKGETMTESEQEAIRAFILASKLLTFPGNGSGVEDAQTGVRDGLLELHPISEELDVNDPLIKKFLPKRKSFIPPLLIIKAKMGKTGTTEYMTIQKKVMARGSVVRGDVQMFKDLSEVPGFRKKLRLFVTACKDFHAATGLLPDLVGNGNVLYTYKGNVYLVDINNISKEPDYKLAALMGYAKELEFKLESPRVEEEKRADYKEEYEKAREEIFTLMCGNPRYEAFANKETVDRIMAIFYIDNKDVVKNRFLRAAGLVDDLSIPIFMHNISNLHGIELDILRSERDEGLFSDEEFRQKQDDLNSEPLYAPLSNSVASWKGVRCFSFDDVVQNKREGHSHWISEYMSKIYGSLSSDGLGL